MTRPKLPRQTPYVPRRVVPPISRRLGSVEFSGYEILQEFEGSSGLVLWCACRDTELWSTRPGMSEVFTDTPAQWGETITRLDHTFAVITPPLRLLANLTPGQEKASIAASCDSIAEWSECQSKLGTAIEFSQVASKVDPECPRYAARTARLLKGRTEWDRSVSWYDHAIFIARKIGDLYAYADACCGLGDLYFERGNLSKSHTLFRRALRAATRHHVEEQIANAYHYLFTLEAFVGNWEQAEIFAEYALAKYPSSSPRRARLARDLGYRWILRGHFDRALPLAQEALGHFTAPALRALVWSDIAHAAAGTGDEEAFESAWAQAKVLLDGRLAEPYTLTILLNLAHGASLRGDGVRASFAARSAAEKARSCGAIDFALEAEALIAS